MSKEIKEILEDLKYLSTINDDNITYKLKNEALNKLLDYITNLQEENERLKDEKPEYILRWKLEEQLEDYKSRNEKAIECIKDNLTREWGEYLYGYEDLLNILNGGDEE